MHDYCYSLVFKKSIFVYGLKNEKNVVPFNAVQVTDTRSNKFSIFSASDGMNLMHVYMFL